MPVPYGMLETSRINAVLQALIDIRQLPQQLTFLSRTAVVPATDAEIIARYIQYVLIADIIADDQAAGVYNSGKLSFETSPVPNIKVGAALSQEAINQLQAIMSNPGLVNDNGYFTDYERRLVGNILLGIRQRMEALIIAMHIDGVGVSYNRLGIQLSGVSWGMPADLKVTPSTAWTNAASATPTTDILTLKRYAAVRYGQIFDRLTMSTSAFIAMIATTEFQNKARFVLPPGQPTSILPLQGTAYMKNLAVSVLEVKELELYDARYWTRNSDGTLTSLAFLPIDKVVFSSTADDNDAQVMDFASSIVTESLVAGMVSAQNGGGVMGGFGGPTRGPVAYASAPHDLNPPNITYWGVARGFPRKKRLQATAIINTGVTTDTIPVGPPY